MHIFLGTTFVADGLYLKPRVCKKPTAVQSLDIDHSTPTPRPARARARGVRWGVP